MNFLFAINWHWCCGIACDFSSWFQWIFFLVYLNMNSILIGFFWSFHSTISDFNLDLFSGSIFGRQSIFGVFLMKKDSNSGELPFFVNVFAVNKNEDEKMCSLSFRLPKNQRRKVIILVYESFFAVHPNRAHKWLNHKLIRCLSLQKKKHFLSAMFPFNIHCLWFFGANTL